MLPVIYGLYDKDGVLRYIGKANDAQRRLKSHMRDARRRNTPLYAWLRKHGVPEIRVLEADCEDWVEAERRLIAEARAQGVALLNLADGGDQPSCPAEVRATNGRRNARAVHDDPERKRFWRLKKEMGALLKRGYVSAETRGKLREAAKRHPHLFGEWANV